ncbi:protein cereblon-like [Oscarella lobularis]|uniref:protein cereblon-like n=1 Tax=Oscarella lobularis TaxID=121494 RepID=UPI003313F542
MAEMEPDVYTFKQGSNVDIFPHTTVERANVRKHASLFRFLSLSFAMKASAWIAILSFISLGVEIAGEQSESEKEVLVCRRCGKEIIRAADLINMKSQVADRQRNDTLLGIPAVLKQTFTNPQGSQFELVTAKRANFVSDTTAYAEHSWFSGYKWRIIGCPVCGFHLGWSFEATDKTKVGNAPEQFVGLILSRLLHEGFADSIIMKPRQYRA